jgi:hypothetical protein
MRLESQIYRWGNRKGSVLEKKIQYLHAVEMGIKDCSRNTADGLCRNWKHIQITCICMIKRSICHCLVVF